MLSESGDIGLPHVTTPYTEGKTKKRKTEAADNRGHTYTTEIKGNAVSKTSQVWSETSIAEESELKTVPTYNDALDRIPINRYTRAQYEGVLTLFDNPDIQTKDRLAATVKYIETYRDELIDALEKGLVRFIWHKP